MGIRTKKIFRIGIFIIIILGFSSPLSFLILGKSTTGKVIKIHTSRTSGKYGGTYYTPILEFQTENAIVTFSGVENSDYSIGDSTTVIYYPFAPTNARVLSFIGLFSYPLLGVAIVLFIWYAFTSSFKDIFDKPFVSRKTSLPKNSNANYTDLPNTVRYTFKGILIFLTTVFVMALLSIFSLFRNNDITIWEFLIGILVTGPMLFGIVKEIKRI